MNSKRSVWIAEMVLGAVAILLAWQDNVTEAVAVAGFIAATLDKLVEKP